LGAGAGRRALALALAAVLAVAAACADSGDGAHGGPAAEPQAAGALPAPSTTLDPQRGPDGPYAVGRRTETFVDGSRVTKANGSAPELPSRTLETLVLYPAEGAPSDADQLEAPPLFDAGPFPLVVFAHGFTASGPVYAVRMHRWAEAGYVVAAPTFPLSQGRAPGGPNFTDYREQPADVRFVIDSMLELDEARPGPLADLVDEEHVAVGGHSLGAITTVGLAFDECCQDDRVDAVFPISAAEWPFDGELEYGVELPLLLIHGDQDAIVPHSGSVAIYRRASAPKFLLTLTDASRIPLFGGPWPRVVDEAVVGFLDRYLKDRASGLDRLELAGVTPGAATMRAEPGTGSG
jgi:fermentation-respiration switch protein FrsA (DUF1100 family)